MDFSHTTVLCDLCSLVHHQKQQASRTLKCMDTAGTSFDKGDFRSVSLVVLFSVCNTKI